MNRSLTLFGLALAIMGFVQGLVPDISANRGLWISAHVAAIQNGLILIVLGCLFDTQRLTSRLDGAIGVLCMFGLYGLWLGLSVSAALGQVSPTDSILTATVQNVASYSLLIGFSSLLCVLMRSENRATE